METLSMPEEIKPVQYIQFVGYTQTEYRRLLDLVHTTSFPSPVHVESDPELSMMGQPFIVTIDVGSIHEPDKGRTVELRPGQLAVWLGAYLMVFDQNGKTKTMTQYSAAISMVLPGDFL